MSIGMKIAEDALLNEWYDVHVQAGYTNFIADGVVDHKLYTQEPVKVLVLLREANWNRKEGEAYRQDLRRELRLGAPNKANWRSWQVVARWIYALTEVDPMDWSALRYHSVYDILFRKTQFQKAAIINVKKTGGGSRLDRKGWKKIIAYCDKHHDIIRRHIELCSPTVIICSGTFDLLVNHVDMKRAVESIRTCSNGIRWCLLGSGCSAMDMPHFGARGRGYTHLKMHEDLVDAWMEIWSIVNLE